MQAFFEIANRGTPDFRFKCYSFFNTHASDIAAPMHWHEEIEILFLTQGSVEAYIAGKAVLLNAGDICFINPNLLHSIKITTDYTTYEAFVFSPKVLTFSGTSFYNEEIVFPIVEHAVQLPKKISASHPHYNEIVRYVQALQGYYKQGNKQRAFILHELVGLFAFLYSFNLFSQVKNNEEPHNIDAIKCCTEYLKLHYAEKITLKDLADLCYMSPNYFCAYYKKITGRTPFSQLNAIRIEASKKLLENPSLAISSVAVSCGFESASYFIRVFKKHTGKSPHLYRKTAVKK